MSKPEPESKLNKFKQFLGIGGSRPSHSATQALSARVATQEFIFTKERLKEISSQTSPQQRLKNIKDLSDIVSTKHLEQNAVESVYKETQDLLRPQASSEERHVELRFLQHLVRGQYNHLGQMRAHFFRVIKGHTLFEDLSPRLDLLLALSSDGRDLEYFEEEMGPFLLDWVKDIMSSARISDFLKLIVNTIKYNAAYLDELVLSGLVMHTCSIATKTKKEEDVQLCLKVLDTVICYSCLPQSSLEYFIVCLCQVLNLERFCNDAWQLMRKLLGTHLGHSAIHTMCTILQENNSNMSGNGSLLLRGAVFYVSMALWGCKKVSSLKYPASAVLPSFLQAVTQNGAAVLANEIVLSIQRLISKYGGEQPCETWDLVLDIVRALFRLIEANPAVSPVIISNLHDVLTTIETLHEQKEFHGSTQYFFSIIEHCATKRPESSINMLIAHKVQDIMPSVKENWILKLDYLLEKYFKEESRTKIRLKVLECLQQIITRNKNLYEDTIIELVVLPRLANIDQETDTEVKVTVVRLIVRLLEEDHITWHKELLAILNKVISKMCQPGPPPLSPTLSGSEQRLHKRPRSASMEIDDVMPAIDGLVNLFKNKFYQTPACVVSRVYELLCEHVQAQYSQPHVILQQQTGVIRRKIFELFLELRADNRYRLGLPDKQKPSLLSYSSNIYCCTLDDLARIHSEHGETTADDVTLLPYAAVFKCIRLCLEKECDWTVLQVVLENLPLVLQNKTLLLVANHADLDAFCSRLCLMVSDRHIGVPDRLMNAPARKSDFHSYIFPVLTCLVSYHTLLDKQKQHDLVRCLEFGLVSRCARICVRALTVCALEMQGIMMRQLPNVLLKMSQISATVNMAIPLMEFLSSLIHSPHLYSNFVDDQYMSVFAIALPYTNPFKYSHYTVSLAYNVVGLWFIKCRVPFRKGFVSFILKNLKSNEIDLNRVAMSQNQDSVDRSRTQSLNDEALRSRSRTAAANARARTLHGPQPVLDEGMLTFHKELMETCVDMLARYTFSTRSNLPKRSPVAEFLLHEGQKQSWLLGNRIITVTTSGGAKVGRAGLCEKCLLQARAASKTTTPSVSSIPVADEPVGRRRHKSAAVRTITESVMLKPLSQDDISVNHRQYQPLEEIKEQRNKSFEIPEINSSDGGKERTSEHKREQAVLETKSDKMQAMDSVLMGLRAKPTDKSIFSPHLCSCWCTQWAEIHVRRPTGTLSWMMRLQNEEELTEVFPDFPLADISSLFMAEKETETEKVPVIKLDHRIDSSKMAENEYEHLLEQHFHGNGEVLSKTNKMFMIGGQGEDPEDTDVFAPESTDSQAEITSELTADDSFLKKANSAPEFSQSQSSPGPNSETSKEVIQALAAKHSSASPQQKSKSPSLQRHKSGEEQRVNQTHSEIVSLEMSPTQRVAVDSPKKDSARLKSGSASTSSFISIPEEGGSTENVTASRLKPGFESPGSSLGGSRSSLVGGIFGKDGATQGGISPSFVFLQLYYNSFFGDTEQRPRRLPSAEAVTRSVKMLDMIYPFQTHKIGVVYVGKEQTRKETAILSNQYGSTRYMEFLQGLGHITRLSDCSPETTYLGGLDTKGGDGKFAYTWQDEVIQVMFHVATMMPNKESDLNCNHKKLHIGNDYVTIVYNDSVEEYKIGTIKGQFNYVNVIVQPLDHGTNAVTVQTRDDIEDIIGHTDTKIISDACLSTLVRQMAVHADLASIILQKQKSNPKDPFASNWLERLRQIKRIRTKVQQETASSPGGGSANRSDKLESAGLFGAHHVNTADDFTDFAH